MPSDQRGRIGDQARTARAYSVVAGREPTRLVAVAVAVGVAVAVPVAARDAGDDRRGSIGSIRRGVDRARPSAARPAQPSRARAGCRSTSVSRSIAARAMQVDHRLGAARVGELEVGAVAQRVVRAGVDADAAQDAAALVDLVLLEDARLGHERAGRARLGAAAAGHARRVVEAHVERRRHERVEADAHEVVAGRADDLRADLGAAAAVDAARRLAQDERVGVVADVVVVDAGEPVLGHAPVAGALVVLRLERLERRPVLDAQAAQVAEADRLAGALEAAGRLGHRLLAGVRELVLDVALVALLGLHAPSSGSAAP